MKYIVKISEKYGKNESVVEFEFKNLDEATAFASAAQANYKGYKDLEFAIIFVSGGEE